MKNIEDINQQDWGSTLDVCIIFIKKLNSPFYFLLS